MEPLRRRIFRWVRLLVEFGLSSGISQAIGMLSGLVYVNYMPVADYALYGLAATTLTFVALSSDLGLGSAITFFWREARAGGASFGQYLRGIRRLRYILFAIVGLIAAAIFPVVGSNSHHGPEALLVALAMLLLNALFLMNGTMKMQIMRLEGWFRRSYLCDIAGQSMRVIVAIVMVAGLSRSYWVALLGGLMSSGAMLGLSAWMLRGTIDRSAAAAPGMFRRILRYAAPAAPAVMAFALQDTVILWLAARYGGGGVVASVFAVNRITAIVGVLTSFSTVVIVPRLSGIADPRRFMVAGWVARGAMALIGLCVVAIGAFLPEPLLWLLGRNYAHLDSEMLVALITAGIGLVSTPTILLNRARGWVRLDPVVAIVQLGLLAVLVQVWDFSTARSVLMLSLVFSASLLLQGLAISVVGWYRPALVEARS